jgi:hypothetical protein
LFTHWFPLVLVVPGVIMLGFWLKRILNPRAHPIYKELARFGDPQQLADQVNQEFVGVKANDVTQFGKTWLAQGNTYGLDLVPWQEIVWLYIHSEVRNRVRTNYVRVKSRGGQQLSAPTWADMDRAEQFLRDLYTRAPWAEVGYSPEIESQWTKQRAEFVARVDARKATLGVSGSPARALPIPGAAPAQ